MKKSLSFLVALALVFGLFASMAAAADTDLTTAQKYQQLVDNKVLKGTTDGDPHLTSNLTRAEFATIAVAIAGLQEDTTSTPAFSDVKVGQWWTGAIQAAYNAGLVNGVGNGLFSPKASVTVQEIIKIAVGIAGLTPVADAKVDGAADWAGPYIKAAQDAGLPIPTNYTAAATRGQTIDLAYAVYLSKQVKPLDEVKATVNADDTITVTGKTAGGVDGVKVAVGTADAAAATLNADGTFTYTTAKQTAGSIELTVTAYKGTTVVTSTKVTADIDGFAVQDVKVLNKKQIAVTFNKAVQYGVTAGGHNFGTGTASSYFALAAASSVAGSNVYPTASDLSDDKMTVTLTWKNGFPLDVYSQFTVSDSLNSASGKSLTYYKQAILLSDSTAPTVSGISYSGPTATVSFSEPLASVGTISLNGSAVTTSNVNGQPYYTLNKNDVNTYGGDITSIKLYNLSADTNYSLNIIYGADLAGNAFDYSGTVSVPSDSSGPAVSSVTVINGSTLKVQYNKAVETSSTSSATPTGVAYNSSFGSKSGTVDSDDNTIVYYDLKDWLGNNTFLNGVSVTIKDARSLFDIAGTAYTTTVSLSKDTAAPSYVSVVYTSDNKIVFQFDKKIKTTGAPGTISYSYVDTNNVLHSSNTATLASVGYDIDASGSVGDSEYVYVAYNGQTSPLTAGTYTFTLPANTFTADSNSLKNESTVYPSLTVSGSTSGSVKLTDVTTNDSGSNPPVGTTQLTFAFNSTLTSSDLDVSKFLINGVALPSGTTFYFADANKTTVLAQLPAGSIPVNGTRTVSVQNIVDANGNTLSTDSSNYSKPVYLAENVKPVAQSVAVVTDRQLAVTFSETLDSSVGTPTGITVKINGNTISADGGYSYSGNVLYIKTTNSQFTSSQSISVTFSSSSVRDIAKNTATDITVNK